jgi:hypothetical protein
MVPGMGNSCNRILIKKGDLGSNEEYCARKIINVL